MTIKKNWLDVHSVDGEDGVRQHYIEFPLVGEGTTLRLTATKREGRPTVILEEGEGSGSEFVGDTEWILGDMQVIQDFTAGLNALVLHAFGWKAREAEHLGGRQTSQN